MGRTKDGADQSASQNGQTNHECEEKEVSIGQRRGLLLENLALIPIFTAQDPHFNFSDFMQKFNSFADFLNWPKEDRLFAIQQRLAGPALQTFANFKEQINNIDDFYKVLGEIYNKEKDPSSVLEDFWNYKQTAGIPVAQYLAIAKQKAKIAVRVQNLPVESQKQTEQQWLMAMLKKNLEPQIRKAIIARNPDNLQELESIAILEEKAWLAVRSEISLPLCEKQTDVTFAVNENNETRNCKKDENITNEIKKLKDIISNLTDKVQKLDKSNARSDKSNIICFFCHLRGHYQSECYKKLSGIRFRNSDRENEREQHPRRSQRYAQRRDNYRPYNSRPSRNSTPPEENRSERNRNTNVANSQPSASENNGSSSSNSLNTNGSL